MDRSSTQINGEDTILSCFVGIAISRLIIGTNLNKGKFTSTVLRDSGPSLERLMKHHGISKKKFLYYIKEMEWRYNNREIDLLGVLMELMLD